MAAGHVPAWKKLGLKLKNANNDVATTNTLDQSAIRKRKQPDSDGPRTNGAGFSRPQKKARDEDTKPPEIFMGVPVIDQTAKRGTLIRFSSPEDFSSTRPKRKSVSFAKDTKTTDGEGVKQLYNTWKTQQGPDFDPSTANGALREVESKPVSSEPFSSSKKSTKKKKKSKSKSTTITSGSTTSKTETSPANTPSRLITQPRTHIPSALQYLNEYFTSRSTWKFNKAKQTNLLKHLFDNDTIPSSYDAALATYLKGLTTGNLSSKLRSEALEIRQTDNDAPFDEPEPEPEQSKDSETASKDIESREKDAPQSSDARKAQYDTALDSLKAQISKSNLTYEAEDLNLDEDLRHRLSKRKRAELTIWALGESDPPAVSANKSSENSRPIKMNVDRQKMLADELKITEPVKKQAETDQSKRKKRARPRKRRQEVADDDLSSDDSSSDEDNTKEQESKIAVGEKAEEDTSSSDSDPEDKENDDTSSSGSDDDSSEDSEASEAEVEAVVSDSSTTLKSGSL